MKKLFKQASGWVRKQKQKVAVACGSFAVAAIALAGTATPTYAAPVDFTGITLPFSVPDMLTTAMNFLALYGPWILLALGVIFAPVLYGLAINLASAAKKRAAAK